MQVHPGGRAPTKENAMYLYTRTASAAPNKMLEATAFAAEIAAKVNSITSLGVRAWSVVFGAPLTTIVWTAAVEHPSDMASTGDKLLADASYLDSVAGAAGLFDGPLEDSMIEMISILGNHEGDPSYASSVSARCATGRIGDAMAWGVDIADHVHSVTGRDGIFGRSLYGPWAEVRWITMADTAEAVDAAEAAMTADPGYLTRIDQAGNLFLPESGIGHLSRRIG